MADLNEESREVDTNKDGGITVKIDVDVSEALIGLKAVTREAREATKAVKELESLNGNTKLNIDSGDFSIGTESGFLFRIPPHETIEINTKDAAYTEHKYDMSAVPTAQLVEELASRDGVESLKFGDREVGAMSIRNNGEILSSQQLVGSGRLLAVID